MLWVGSTPSPLSFATPPLPWREAPSCPQPLRMPTVLSPSIQPWQAGSPQAGGRLVSPPVTPFPTACPSGFHAVCSARTGLAVMAEWC